MTTHKRVWCALAGLLAVTSSLPAATQRAVVTNDQRVYREATVESKTVARLYVGEELTVTGREGPMVQVAGSGERAGWTLANGVVVLDENPRAPALLFQAAEEMSRDASRDAWRSAARLFRKAATLDPSGIYAAEAAWRSAELNWKAEVNQTGQVTDSARLELAAVATSHPKTPQAAQAAFLLMRADLCDVWDGTPGCLEAEIGRLTSYLGDYSASDGSHKVRYAIAYRHAALVEIYLQQDKPHFNAERAVMHKSKAVEAIAATVQEAGAQGASWAAKAERLAWSLEHNIGVFSSVEAPLRPF